MTTFLMGNGVATVFLNLSSDNTINNIETMGVLFGRYDRVGKKVVCKKVALFQQFGDATRCGLTTEGEIQLAEQLATM